MPANVMVAHSSVGSRIHPDWMCATTLGSIQLDDTARYVYVPKSYISPPAQAGMALVVLATSLALRN